MPVFDMLQADIVQDDGARLIKAQRAGYLRRDTAHGPPVVGIGHSIGLRLIQRRIALPQIDKVGFAVYRTPRDIGWIDQRRISSGADIQPILQFLPVHITGIFFACRINPLLEGTPPLSLA